MPSPVTELSQAIRMPDARPKRNLWARVNVGTPLARFRKPILKPSEVVVKHKFSLSELTSNLNHPVAKIKDARKCFKLRRLIEQYKRLVTQKFNIEARGFLRLRFNDISEKQQLVQKFFVTCERGLAEGKSSQKIVDDYISEQFGEKKEAKFIQEKLFEICQYVKRLVSVLASVENAALNVSYEFNGEASLLQVANDINLLINNGVITRPQAKEMLKGFAMKVVFTAHPTEPQSRDYSAIEAKLMRVYELEARGGPYSMAEQEMLDAKSSYLYQMGTTKSRNTEAPDPLQEGISQIGYMKNCYRTLPIIYKRLNDMLQVSDFDEPSRQEILNSLNFDFGTWASSDRDGNPYVTSDMTSKYASYLRKHIIDLYLEDISVLKENNPGLISKRWNPITESLQFLKRDDLEVYEKARFHTVDDLMGFLSEIKSDLYRDDDKERLDELIVKLKIFGLHFVSLQARQKSDVISATVASISRVADSQGESYSSMPADKKWEYLEQHFAKEHDSMSQESLLNHDFRSLDEQSLSLDEAPDLVKDTLDVLAKMPLIQKFNGEQGFCQFNISNTRGALEVKELLFTAYKMRAKQIDIVPLFESVDDLNNSEATLEKLFQDEQYREHLRFRENKQIVLLGFSDGMKDGSVLTAAWKIHEVKEKLTKLAEKYGIKMIFFEGRGGSTARGGLPTFEGQRANGSTVSSDGWQVTFQGDVLRTMIGGTPRTALRNLEPLYAGGIQHRISSYLHKLVADGYMKDEQIPSSYKQYEMTSKQKDFLAWLAEKSLGKYQELVKGESGNGEEYYKYLEAITPLDFFQFFKMASRPVSRKKITGFTGLRAIPCVGAPATIGQNNSAFLPLGSIYEILFEENRLEEFYSVVRSCPFLRGFFSNVAQGLMKCNFEVTKYLGDDEQYGGMWKMLKAQYDNANKLLAPLVSNETDSILSPITTMSVRQVTKLGTPLMVILDYALRHLKENDMDEIFHTKIPSSRNPEDIGNSQLIIMAALSVIGSYRNLL